MQLGLLDRFSVEREHMTVQSKFCSVHENYNVETISPLCGFAEVSWARISELEVPC